jgi:hypothetical protein
MAADDFMPAQTARNFASAAELVLCPLVVFSDEVHAKASAPSLTVRAARTALSLGLSRQHKSAAETQLIDKETKA